MNEQQTRGEVLQTALDLINGPRHQTYGNFSENVSRMRHIMKGMTGRRPSRHEIHAFFIALKLCRNNGKEWTKDTLADLCGYAALIYEDREG